MRILLGTMLVMAMLATQAVGADVTSVKAEAFASTTAVRAGEPFMVAVRMTIDPGWHIYWENPGDAGLATKVRLQVPEGFSAKPLDFPLPVRFVQAGDIVGYGYKGEAIFLTRVTPGDQIPASGDISIGIDASWLCCSDRVCVPGGTKFMLKIPVATAGNPGASANQELFEKAQAALPASAPPDEVATVSPMGGGVVRVQIDWKQQVKKVDAFPFAMDALEIKQITAETSGNRTAVRLEGRVLTGQKLKMNDLPVLVVYLDNNGRRRGFFTAIDLRPLAAPGAK